VQINIETIDATLAAAGHKATVGGTATTFVGWALSSQGTAAIGIVIGLCGLVIQLYFRRKQDKREQAEHERKMALYD
jgi:hypothetical protein